MIHQFIFAAPKPGMSVARFQEYWVTEHAVRYASKIPQIVRYLVDTRVPFDDDAGSPPLPHQGIAEIWLENDAEQLASLQTPEFVDGARADEPNWAAFWQDIVVDTTAHDIIDGEPEYGRKAPWVKYTQLLKRAPGTAIESYRRDTLSGHADAVGGLPGIRRHLHCHTRDNAYVFGEPPFDSVEQTWFDDVEALRAALRSPHHAERVAPSLAELTDPRYRFALTAEEHWVIGPALRTAVGAGAGR